MLAWLCAVCHIDAWTELVGGIQHPVLQYHNVGKTGSQRSLHLFLLQACWTQRKGCTIPPHQTHGLLTTSLQHPEKLNWNLIETEGMIKHKTPHIQIQSTIPTFTTKHQYKPMMTTRQDQNLQGAHAHTHIGSHQVPLGSKGGCNGSSVWFV